MYIYICIHMCVYAYIYMYRYIYTCIYTHTPEYTQRRRYHTVNKENTLTRFMYNIYIYKYRRVANRKAYYALHLEDTVSQK